MSRKKILNYFLVILILVLGLNFSTYSFSGWNFIDGEYCFLNSEGRKLLNVWRENSDGNLYYLGEDGNLVRNKMFEYNGNLYYVNSYGIRVRNEFVEITDENRDKSLDIINGKYYFDDKGRAFKRNDNVFKKNIDGAYYAFDEQGLVLTGWLDKDGYSMESNDTILTEGLYYASDDGKLYSNRWYNFDKDAGTCYIGDDLQSSYIASRYCDMDSLWMYFDSNCKRIYANDGKGKNKTINGKKYAFDANGIMVQGFTQNSDVVTTQESNPTMAEKVKLYNPVDGDLMKNQWRKTAPSSFLSAEEYADDQESWFYADNSGNLTYNKIKLIDGKKYAFDGLGRMKTGFVLMDQKSYFVASYKPEELTRDDFVYSVEENGKLYGSELSNLHFFGEDEIGDGAMRTGTVKIELNDGIYEFCFKNSTGAAYGSKGEMKKYGDVYYINGLKLEPMDDMKYGIIKIGDEYKVVNANGKVIKGNKKLIKDDYENYIIIRNGKFIGYYELPDTTTKIKWVASERSDMGSLYQGPGYYLYNSDTEIKAYTEVVALSSKEGPTDDELKKLPKEMKLNFK